MMDGSDGARDVTIALLGDIILDVDGPDHWLGGIAPVLRAADVTIGHLEVPYTHSQDEAVGDVPAPGANPAHLDALARAGVGVVTMAGNHMMDCGPGGLVDTMAGLARNGIAHCGAGVDDAAARRPAIIPVGGGRRLAVLSYNCVGPELCWAGVARPGWAHVRVAAEDG
ncbi:MAG: CapA family protein, partial [Sphingopyxis sp.]